MFTIDAGFIIWAVIALACILLMLASLRSPAPRRGMPVVTVEEALRVVEAHGKAAAAAAATVAAADMAASLADPAPDVVARDKETRHWVAHGLRKLGYSMDEGRRMADAVPSGMELQDALQWCLRNKGARK